MPSPQKRLEIVLLAAISICYIVWCAAFIRNTSFIAIDGNRYFLMDDDAMISMRYAWNFSHGNGLVWNVGERVEGYTNFLMVALMSLVMLGFDKLTSPLIVKILGMCFMLGAAYASMRFADTLAEGAQKPIIRLLFFTGILLYYPLNYWSLMGMETGLLALLLLLNILSALDYVKTNDPKYLWRVALFAGLAYLTRNDSIVYSFLLWAYIGCKTWNQKEPRKNFFAIAAAFAAFSLFIIGQTAFRLAYYGEWLPNTYTLKLTGMPLNHRIRNGIGFITPFLAETSVLLLLPIVDIFIRFKKQKLILLLIPLFAIAYQVYVGGDALGHWRMLSPAMPALILLFIVAADSLIGFLSAREITKNIVFALVLLIGFLSANASSLSELFFLENPRNAEKSQEIINTAIAIEQVTTPNATIGLFWAGIIPYYTERRGIDFLGKCDKHIAQLHPDLSGSVQWGGMYSIPGHNKYDLEYSIKFLMPTYAQGLEWGNQRFDGTKWAKENYVAANYNGILLYLRRKSPDVFWEKVYAP